VRTRDLPVSAAMTGLVVNEVEASALTDIPVRSPADAARAAAALRQRGPRFVIVTLGKEGAVVHGADLAEHVPTFVVEPVDTTAAGDTFCGALAVALVEKRSLLEAVRFAHAASALSVTRMGAQPSIAWRKEIEAFMATAQLRPRT
jgi:ribokinase